MMTLTNLNWLNLSNNKIRSIPPEINNLTKLEELGLGMNEIQEIPCMNKLTQLRIFPAFKNKITKIHPSVFSLPSIEKLDFSDNQLDQFPFEALESKKLRYLNLRCNLISSIESSLLNHKLTSKILMIDISENNLKYIPFKFFKIFEQYANVRLGGNPYSLGESKKPINLSLTEICISKILKRSNSLDPWIDKMYNHRNICDFCGSGFVSEPFYLYVKSFIDPESEFVVEKSLCSNACLNKCNKNRVRSIRRQ
ncbi:FLII [Hepatospora eriocheir]|nr:FLII [Hepatospora eriocheir]